MNKLSQPWISGSRIETLVQLEPALAILGLVVISWFFYKIFLRKISDKRHRRLTSLFSNLALHLLIAVSSFVGYYLLLHSESDQIPYDRIAPYVGLLAIFSWSIVFVKVSRILLFEYLFFNSMRTGVPVLLVNLLTLLMTVVLVLWLGTELFNFQIGPLLATSAIFSVVLGLALQDTLGNLFAGVAMQFDKPYEIGDWIEIVLANQKWVGQVQEISWRATVLIGLTEEAITLPNRLMSQTQISNFSARKEPILRSQVFRIAPGTPLDRIHGILIEAARQVPEVARTPGPNSFIMDTNESWIPFKVTYYISDYGKQWMIGDRVIRSVTSALQREGIELAPSRILVMK